MLAAVTPKRLPRGYQGLNHETLGSDILALAKAITATDQLLGAQRAEQLRNVKPELWYPISMLLEPLDELETRLGSAIMKKIGWTLFNQSHAERFAVTAKSARDVVYGIDKMYHHANRGTDIGGWKVLDFNPGLARLEKNTPHQCVMEEGILEEALRTLKIPALVSQETCFRKGAPVCTYAISSLVRDARWSG
ncbi:MAG: hypothetical protein IPJ65_09590 [Archangiaceae bacterium]|nr:hypothetical protein [Archangiaceae bacterium]